jgi:hypothetical protein
VNFLTLTVASCPKVVTSSTTGRCAMSGQQRLSREGTRRGINLASDLNFGLIAFVLLSAVAIIVAWKFPEFQMQYVASPQRRPQVSAPPAPSSHHAVGQAGGSSASRSGVTSIIGAGGGGRPSE